MRRSNATVIATTAGLLAGTAAAGLDGGDIGLDIVNGRIVTSLIGEEGSAPSPERIFLAELGVVEFEEAEPGDPTSGGTDVFQDILPAARSFSTNTPGFDSEPGTFAAGSRVGFAAPQGLRLYDPARDALVSARNAGSGIGGAEAEALVVEFNTTVFQTDPIAGSPFPLSLATPGGGLDVFANGRFHRHWNFVLFPVDNIFDPNPTPLAEPGVYVLELVMTSTDPAAGESLPFYVLFPYEVAEDGPEVEGATALLRRTIDPSDFNGDGARDIFDVLAFFTAFGG